MISDINHLVQFSLSTPISSAIFAEPIFTCCTSLCYKLYPFSYAMQFVNKYGLLLQVLTWLTIFGRNLVSKHLLVSSVGLKILFRSLPRGSNGKLLLNHVRFLSCISLIPLYFILELLYVSYLFHVCRCKVTLDEWDNSR